MDRLIEISAETSGTPDQVAEKPRAMEAVAMTYTIAYFPDVAYDRSSLELFTNEVIPQFS